MVLRTDAGVANRTCDGAREGPWCDNTRWFGSGVARTLAVSDSDSESEASSASESTAGTPGFNYKARCL